MKLGGWNVSHISQYSCFQCLHLPKQPTIWCIVQKKQLLIVSMSAFIFFFFFFFLQSTGILITMDHMFHQGAAGHGVCFCVTVFCMFAANKQKNVHFLTQLADCCVSALPPQSYEVTACCKRGKKCSENLNSSVEVLSQTNPDAAVRILSASSLLDAQFLFVSFAWDSTSRGCGFFFFLVGKKKKTCCGGRVYRYEGGFDLSAHHSSSVGVCLSLKDVAALKKHRFTLVSVLGSDQIELSFFIFVCLHCISPTDSNFKKKTFFACACAEFGAPRLPLLNVLWF